MVKNDISVVLIQRNGAKIFFKFYFNFVTHQIRTLEKNVLIEKHLSAANILRKRLFKKKIKNVG